MTKKSKQKGQPPNGDGQFQPETASGETVTPATEKATDEKNDQAQPTSTEQEAQERIKKLEENYLRLRADKENQAKRLQAEIDRAEKRGIEQVISGLLEIADNLEFALDQQTDNLQAVQEGVRMTLSQLQGLMSANGIEAIEPETGEKLDPNMHMAIIQEESVTISANTIIRTEIKGYRHQQRILRPAKVVVAKAGNKEQKASQPSPDQGDASEKAPQNK